jgi:hypothetical protein
LIRAIIASNMSCNYIFLVIAMHTGAHAAYF